MDEDILIPNTWATPSGLAGSGCAFNVSGGPAFVIALSIGGQRGLPMAAYECRLPIMPKRTARHTIASALNEPR